MSSKTSISNLITSFFTNYLPNDVGYSDNTIRSYRDTFVLYFTFTEQNHLCPHGKTNVGMFSKENILHFLEWLETSRKVSTSTRNQRLATLKSFSKYVSSNSPEYLETFQQILSIKVKKTVAKTVDYLSADAIALLLKQPCIGNITGLRDLAFLSLLYESGCRVQEIIDTKYGNISFNSPVTITVIGKGNKVRIFPISTKVANIIKKYTVCYKIFNPQENLFTNNRKEPLTRSGVTYILKKYVAMAKIDSPELFYSKVHPHTLRHSKAMHLLENGVNLIYIQ